VLLGQKSLSEVTIEGPCGVRILPTSSGREQLTRLTAEQQLILQAEFDRLEESVDVLLIDTGAGIGSNVLYFTTMAREIVVVASPEPTSITDAYAVMKVLSKRHGERRFRLLVNMARGDSEAREVYRKLNLVADRFLDIMITYIGYIPKDDYLPMAVCEQRAVVECFPQTRSSLSFVRLAQTIKDWPSDGGPKGGVQLLWRMMLSGAPASIPAAQAACERREG